MNILHINTYDTGGAAIACLRIHQELLSQGVNSKVLVRNRKNKNNLNVYEIWEELNAIQKASKFIKQKKFNEVIDKTYNNNFNDTELYSPPQAIWDITKSKLYKEADIIHLHWVAGFLDYTSFFNNCNKKVVWTIHDFAPFSNGLHYPISIDPKYNKLLSDNLKIKTLALKNKNIQVVSPSNYLLEQSKKSNLFKPFNHFHIPNGTSKKFSYIAKKLAREKLGVAPNEKIILFVSDTLNYKRKGLELLIKIIPKLKEHNISLYTVGNGEIDNPDIKCYGEVTNEGKLNLIYASANLFVIPSLNDNFPNTIAEALCSGTPTLGFKTGGIPEMINKNCGELCEKINPEMLLDSIIKTINIDFNYEKLSEDAVQKFSITNCVNSYKDIYTI